MQLFFKTQLAFLAIACFLTGCNRSEEAQQKQSQEYSEETPSHFEELKALNWLAGNWVDDEADIDLKISYKWGKNKNFLIQSFNLKDSGHEDIEGQQYIGWDPVQSRIRSWLFDSDGNFGEGYWIADGDNLYSNVIFTLNDGRKASATHIYTKINDDTYTFASENRDINGEVLPSIGPFKVIRK